MRALAVTTLLLAAACGGSSTMDGSVPTDGGGADAPRTDGGGNDGGGTDGGHGFDAGTSDAGGGDASVGSPWTGTTVDAASCSLDDVRAALAAARDGDTVAIPAGSCTWADALVVDKLVRILGAGIDATNLEGGAFRLEGDATFRVSGMTLTGTAGFDVAGHAHGWRIDHIHFDHVSGYAANRIVWVNPAPGGYTTGLVDHCEFDNPNSIQVHIREGDGGNGSYERPLDLGGEDAIYVEDCDFHRDVLEISDPVTDCEGGGRIVVRHSHVANSYTEMHDAIIGGLRSCRRWETYANTFETTYPSGQCAYVGIRGGTGVVYDNTFVNMPDCTPIQLALYRTYQRDSDPWDMLCGTGSGSACLAPGTTPMHCASDADCGGVAGACAPIDGPATSPDGYPCRDQLGTDGNAPQVSRPALFWNNHFMSGAQSDPEVNMAAGYVTEGVDYCAGATMPATCNGLATTYAPYPYPHPLTAL